MKYPFFKQFDQMDCGPTCLRMIARYYGKTLSIQRLRNLSQVSRDGISFLFLIDAAEKIGFSCNASRKNFSELTTADCPCILHWEQNHFVVLYRVKKGRYLVGDPASGLVQYNTNEFKQSWLADIDDPRGIVMFLKPTEEFFKQDDEINENTSLSVFFKQLPKYRWLIIQIFIGLTAGSIIQLIAPFLTQVLVDIGIQSKNVGYLTIIILAQGMFILGRLSLEYLRTWILLHISSRINISILSDFIIKMMKLPMGFFDSKQTGDLMQRINDQKNIEIFLTSSAFTSMFSFVNLILFSIILAFYNMNIFIVFIIGSSIYFVWILSFLKKRRQLNGKSFEIAAKNQSSVLELINGMQEIKLNNYEEQKRWGWENIQAVLFDFNIKLLSLNQSQQGGATLINEVKNLIITAMSVIAVVRGELTIGGMVALQYIVGQLHGPLDQIIGFIQGFQDAKISIERINEVLNMQEEEPENLALINLLPDDKSIYIKNLSFEYTGSGAGPVINNIDLIIPEGKITAIVGMSGSGKTTLIKLLLRFYKPQGGEIKVGYTELDNLKFKTWRSQCGVVMQDGFIFSDTIERNIALDDEFIDSEKMNIALTVANIADFVFGLPLGLKSKVGSEGTGISQGQKQRLLIARAVYKNPHYLFFDEATNALDANNETLIMHNLNNFFSGRTVIIVAHRLSTVSNADNIIVMDKGIIVEQGKHDELIKNKSNYFTLIKNQLELGT